jgi:hypothetical protein
MRIIFVSADTVNTTAGPQLLGNLVERCISVLTPLTTSNEFVFVTSRLASP